MYQEEKEDLKRAGNLLATEAELAGDAVMLLGITGRMADAGQVEAIMFQFGNIAREIGKVLDEVVEGKKRGG